MAKKKSAYSVLLKLRDTMFATLPGAVAGDHDSIVWMRYAFADERGGHCLMGGMEHVLGLAMGFNSLQQVNEITRAANYLAAACVRVVSSFSTDYAKRLGKFKSPEVVVMEFNDTYARDREDIFAALNLAIADAKRRHINGKRLSDKNRTTTINQRLPNVADGIGV